MLFWTLCPASNPSELPCKWGNVMVYSLLDAESNNLVAEFDTATDVLALVRRGIERNGPNDTDTLVLEVEDEQGEVRVVAHGRRLAELADGVVISSAMSAS